MTRRSCCALARAAGIADPQILSCEGWARFASIEEFGRIEIKGSPLAAIVDDAAYARVLTGARDALAEFVDREDGLAIPLGARVLAARKG